MEHSFAPSLIFVEFNFIINCPTTARATRSAAVKAAIYHSMFSETVKIFDLVFVS